MEQPYSVLADALSKYQSSPDWVQALWLVAVPVTVVGSVACVARAVTTIAMAMLVRRRVLHNAALPSGTYEVKVAQNEAAPQLTSRRTLSLPETHS